MLFTLFDAYVLRPATVHDPYSLYQLAYSTQRVRTQPSFTWDQYQALRSGSPALTDAIASEEFFARVDRRSLGGLLVSGNYFTMLGIPMTFGRPILPEDAATLGAGQVVVLSYQIWKSEFGADPSIVGRKILVNGQPMVVIGICGADFAGLSMTDTPEDLYMPVTMAGLLVPHANPFAADRPAVLQLVGRLLPAISQDRAKAALTVTMSHLTESLPPSEQAAQAVLVSKATALPLDPKILAIFSPLILTFGLVLVICCANVTNMMLARAIARQREIGVRLSLGAGRSRLVCQLLSESLLLALLAGAVGLAVSQWATRGAQHLLFSTAPASYAKLLRLLPLNVDRRVLLFIVLTAGLATVTSGLAPALQATRVTLVSALRGEFIRLQSSRLRYALVVSQITVCLLLLVLTGVLVRSSSAYQATEIGYSLRGVVSPMMLNRPDPSSLQRLAGHLALQPWVGGLAATMRPPLSGISRSIAVTPAGSGQAEPTTIWSRPSTSDCWESPSSGGGLSSRPSRCGGRRGDRQRSHCPPFLAPRRSTGQDHRDRRIAQPGSRGTTQNGNGRGSGHRRGRSERYAVQRRRFHHDLSPHLGERRPRAAASDSREEQYRRRTRVAGVGNCRGDPRPPPAGSCSGRARPRGPCPGGCGGSGG